VSVTLKDKLPDGRLLFEKDGTHFSLTSEQLRDVVRLSGVGDALAEALREIGALTDYAEHVDPSEISAIVARALK
jgi:hypothetical protein